VSLGRLVIDDIAFDIRRIFLRDGETHYEALIHGPLPAHEAGFYGCDIYAPDGSVVLSTTAPFPAWEECVPGTTITVDLPVANIGSQKYPVARPTS
jgi:hypothetical protein